MVPLGVEARTTFRVINDGYENINLECYIPQDLGHIPLKIHYPDG